MTLSIDYTNMLSGAVSGGIPLDAWEAAQRDFRGVHAAVKDLRGTGALGTIIASQRIETTYNTQGLV